MDDKEALEASDREVAAFASYLRMAVEPDPDRSETARELWLTIYGRRSVAIPTRPDGSIDVDQLGEELSRVMELRMSGAARFATTAILALSGAADGRPLGEVIDKIEDMTLSGDH